MSPPASEGERQGDTDRQALCQRALAAAETAESRYSMPGGTRIECWCIGQPRDGEDPAPLVEECTQRPELWNLPPQGRQIRLAFLWRITQGRSVDWADSCVARLDHAEQRGVPLPPHWAPVLADLIGDGAQDKGACQDGQICVASQPSIGTFSSARCVATYQCHCCPHNSSGRARDEADGARVCVVPASRSDERRPTTRRLVSFKAPGTELDVDE